jgi:hypothetical protein
MNRAFLGTGPFLNRFRWHYYWQIDFLKNIFDETEILIENNLTLVLKLEKIINYSFSLKFSI